MHAYQVMFKQQGYWSKSYTYKSEEIFSKGDVVVVPTGDFYSIGKIADVKLNYDFKEPHKFKSIHSKVEVTETVS